MIVYRCGCRNDVQADTGLLRCVGKCDHHRDFLKAQPTGADYYRHLGALSEDLTPNSAPYLAELVGALGPPPPARPGAAALEVGGGASPYVAALLALGYRYVGVEPDPWAAQWTLDTYGDDRVTMISAPYPVELPAPVQLILCAHALEHVADAPACLKAMHIALEPGGTLLLLVPDDSDPTNPDHLWFFTAEALVRLAERTGFHVTRVEVRPHPRENFIYLRATAGAAEQHG